MGEDPLLSVKSLTYTHEISSISICKSKVRRAPRKHKASEIKRKANGKGVLQLVGTRISSNEIQKEEEEHCHKAAVFKSLIRRHYFRKLE